jgi:hypothetical protein
MAGVYKIVVGHSPDQPYVVAVNGRHKSHQLLQLVCPELGRAGDDFFQFRTKRIGRIAEGA